MKHKHALIIFVMVSLVTPYGFSISTSAEMNIHVPTFIDWISFKSKFDSAYPKQKLIFDISINVLESKDGMTLKDLISSNYKLEIIDETGKEDNLLERNKRRTIPNPH